MDCRPPVEAAGLHLSHLVKKIKKRMIQNPLRKCEYQVKIEELETQLGSVSITGIRDDIDEQIFVQIIHLCQP